MADRAASDEMVKIGEKHLLIGEPFSKELRPGKSYVFRHFLTSFAAEVLGGRSINDRIISWRFSGVGESGVLRQFSNASVILGISVKPFLSESGCSRRYHGSWHTGLP